MFQTLSRLSISYAKPTILGVRLAWQGSRKAASSSLGWLVPASSIFSPAFAAQQAVTLSSKARNKSRIPEVDSKWASTCAELARNAAQGTRWPQQSKEVLQRVNDLLGGRWLLVESGLYTTPGHPRVGEPARALVHVAMCYVGEPQQGKAGIDGFESSSSGSKGRRSRGQRMDVPLIHTMKEPTKLSELPVGSKSMWLLATYELDTSGWPTGRMYNSATHLEKDTQHAHFKKPEQSFRIIWQGHNLKSVFAWAKLTVGGSHYGMVKPPKNYVFDVHNWYRAAVEAKDVGVFVMREMDAASLSAKRRRERADAIAAADGRKPAAPGSKKS